MVKETKILKNIRINNTSSEKLTNEIPDIAPRRRDINQVKKINKTVDVKSKIKKEREPISHLKRHRERRKKEQLLKNTRSNIPVLKPESDNNNKPNIVMIVDVEGWAWWIKSHIIKKYLSDEFNFTIINMIDHSPIRVCPNSFDLYFTFGYSFVSYLKKVPLKKRISGVTAHRNKSIVSDLKKVKWIHANSIMLIDELVKYGYNKNDIFYVPNGVDTDMFYSKNGIPVDPKSDNITVGHIGKLSPLKGQKDIIEPAVKMAKCEYIYHYNTYEDKIPHDQMADLYQNMDVFIVASKEDGTPNPALEAAACGRPILTNAIGNMPELIKDGYNGFIVNKQISKYVDKIKWFRNNKDEMVEMGKNARKSVVEGWQWKHQVENYRHMFRSILEKIS